MKRLGFKRITNLRKNENYVTNLVIQSTLRVLSLIVVHCHC